MRFQWLMVPTLSLVACGGDNADTTGSDSGFQELTCDDIATRPLGQVPTTEWDPTLAGMLDDSAIWPTLAGRWTADSSCGEPVVLAMTFEGTDESLEIVDGYPTGLQCGCVDDPVLGADSVIRPTAIDRDFTVFVESFSDPGLDAQTLDGTLSLLDGSDGAIVRGCGEDTVDPATFSDFETVTVSVRMDAYGIAAGTILMLGGPQGSLQCDLTNFVPQL